jgi:hypothetical protein
MTHTAAMMTAPPTTNMIEVPSFVLTQCANPPPWPLVLSPPPPVPLCAPGELPGDGDGDKDGDGETPGDGDGDPPGDVLGDALALGAGLGEVLGTGLGDGDGPGAPHAVRPCAMSLAAPESGKDVVEVPMRDTVPRWSTSDTASDSVGPPPLR